MEESDTPAIPNVAKATKQELMDGYRELLKKYQELSSEGGKAEDKTQKQLFEKTKKYQASGDISQAISQTRLAIGTSLQEAEDKLLEKFEELKNLEAAAAVRQDKLKELYEIEEAAGSLMAVLQAKEEAKRLAQAEKELLEQKRKRDEEEYRFNFDLQKRKDKETYEAEKRKLESELEERERMMAEKEKGFADKQEEFEMLKTQAAEFPQKMEEVKKETGNSILAEAKKDKETALMILQKETEAQKTVYEAHIKNLETLMEEQKSIVKSLQQQLSAAQAQTQEVVLKSIESASGNKALDAVNKFALEQSRSGGSQK